MEIQITKNLKEFRRKQGNTQEELATHLNISVQAVSKWERGEGFPDISLLPQIAAFYDISVDKLLGCGEIEKDTKIKEYHDQCLANSKEEKQEENIAMLHEALKEFPHDVSLLYELCFSLGFSQKEEYADECIEVGKAVLEQNPTEEFYRHGAIQRIALAYHQKRDDINAKKYAELLPDFFHTKSKTLEQILEGAEKCRCAQENIMHCLHAIDNSVNLYSNSLFFNRAHFGNPVGIKSSPELKDLLDEVKTAMSQPQFDFVRDMDEWKTIISE